MAAARAGSTVKAIAGRITAGTDRLGTILALILAEGPADASVFAPLQPPLSLPQTLRGTVVVPLRARPEQPADTLSGLYPVLAACWMVPTGSEHLRGVQITARLALRRDGQLIAEPRITFAAGAASGPVRAALAQATLASIRRCTPAHITPALGGAIAGRPVALRFLYRESED
jgi:hypothetical protein